MGRWPCTLENLEMNFDFWRDKRVFLTGHTGFKGSWLSIWLKYLGAKLTGYAFDVPTAPSLFQLAEVDQGMTSVIGDIRDQSILASALRSASPEIVVHMAAQSLVRHSYTDPVGTYSTNVMGTVNLLESIRYCPSVRAVVIVTTDKCYQNQEWVWPYRENEPMGGYDPYSSSKGCAELVTSAYRASFFNPNAFADHRVSIASARAGNVIGGGDWAPNRLVPDVLSSFSKGAPAIIRNPHAVRPWQHVLEPLRGYLTLAQRLFEDGAQFSEAFNFGPLPDGAKPVSAVVDQLAELWGGGAAWRVDTEPQPHEAQQLALDISKAGSFLRWYPILQLREALSMTVSWSLSQGGGGDVKTLTTEQIKEYMSKI